MVEFMKENYPGKNPTDLNSRLNEGVLSRLRSWRGPGIGWGSGAGSGTGTGSGSRSGTGSGTGSGSG